MTSVPEGHALHADSARTSAYVSFSVGYTAENETGLLHMHYNRPALLELAGDVAGRRILDVGCGSGPLFAALRDRGAVVTGIDASARMLEQARRRLGDDVPYARPCRDSWRHGSSISVSENLDSGSVLLGSVRHEPHDRPKRSKRFLAHGV